MQLKTQHEETRNLLQTSKNVHLRHIEQMEVIIFVFNEGLCKKFHSCKVITILIIIIIIIIISSHFQSDELTCQKKLRTELIQLEDTLAQVRKEYEMLRIEFEQTLAANEQTGRFSYLHISMQKPNYCMSYYTIMFLILLLMIRKTYCWLKEIDSH